LQKAVVDLLLDERMIPGKFGCTGYYGVVMHKEQTNKHSSLYITGYIHVAQI
jgi:translation initiation factor RLI1